MTDNVQNPNENNIENNTTDSNNTINTEQSSITDESNTVNKAEQNTATAPELTEQPAYNRQYQPPQPNGYGSYQNAPYYNPYFNQTPNHAPQASYTFSNDPSYGADANEAPKKKDKKKKKGGALKVAAIILACVILSGASGIGGAFLSRQFIGGPSQSTQSNNNQTQSPAPSNNAPVHINKVEGSTTPSTSMTDVIAAVRDSVVEIVTENIQESAFYGQYVTSGAGSGVIISQDGYIITNNHVVEGANSIQVTTTNGAKHKAQIVGTDAESDVAIIKIDAKELSFATLGDSDAIKLGEEVIAIGNPLGSLGGTVTNGIISALNREISIDGQKMVLLQTNAAVNPGNSGGGLFNMAGELIGVVNAKSSSSSSETTIEGLGFAIPINHAFDVASQLIEFGYVKGKVSLGIKVYIYEKDYTYTQGWQTYVIKAGVYVEEPGKNTELKKNDRFVSLDGITVSNMTDIKGILAEHKVGDTIEATVARVQDKKEYLVTVTLTCYEFVPESEPTN